MSGARAKVSAIIVALALSFLAPGCERQYSRPNPVVALEDQASPETPSPAAELPLRPLHSELPITPTAVAEPASQASASGGPPAERVQLAQATQMEPLPTPAGTPRKTGDVPLLSQAPAAPGLADGPLLLHVDDADVRKVFEIISRQAKLNILVSPTVTGRVTLDLHDMTVDEGLQAVARLCHLTVRREKDVLYVYTTAEMDQGDDPPLRVYHLNYVRGSDLQKMIKPLLTKRGASTTSPDSEIGIKSDATKAGGDSPGGGDVLIVQDCERVLQAVDRVVAQLDVQPVQVLIEAVILSVKLDKDLELGVNFATLGGGSTVASVLGSGAALNAAAGFTPASVVTKAGQLVGNATSGLAEAQHGFKFGYVSNSVTGFVRALQTCHDVQILATPRLMVVNKQRAELQLGDRLGYETATQTQTSTVQTVQFMDIGTQLRLRPFVTSDGIVRMEIHPENSTGALDVNGIPQTSCAQVTTNVMIPDGMTVVIGGLIENDKDVSEQGLPWLNHLPWIGFLFRQTVDKPTRRELIIILTPHIWNPKAPAQLNNLKAPERVDEAKARAGIGCDPLPHGTRAD
jgi:type IV pilus secretin PilQ/predicted competence protein